MDRQKTRGQLVYIDHPVCRSPYKETMREAAKDIDMKQIIRPISNFLINFI